MEIRIDTQKDSKEEIRKAIKFLKSIAEEGEQGGSSTGISFEVPPAAENAMAIFGNEQGEPKVEDAPALPEKKKKQIFGDDKIEIIPY